MGTFSKEGLDEGIATIRVLHQLFSKAYLMNVIGVDTAET